jgi:CRP-like cAMP-binding protein
MTPTPAAVQHRASAETVYQTGESGPVWRLIEGLVRLDRHQGGVRQVVHLALPGDLIGVEALCDQRYQFSAVAFTACRLEPLALDNPLQAREPLLRQALLQQHERCQDMASLRSGTVPQRMAHLLRLLGFDRGSAQRDCEQCARSIREALPALREVAQMVDAKTETVCRALAQLLPPRSDRPGAVPRVDRCWRNNAVRLEALV